MEIIINDNKQFNVQLIGRLDANTAPDLQDVLTKQYINTNCNKNIIFDCSGLEYLSSAGLRIIVSMLKYADSKNASIKLVNVNDEVYEIFQITGFADVLNIRQ